MSNAGRTLAWLSLAMGVVLVVAVFLRQGSALSVGLVFGALLVLNGAVRLWLARNGGVLRSSKDGTR